MDTSDAASTLQLLGAGAFGLVLGWYLYYINRYRTGEVQTSDLVSVISALGGGTVVALFPARSDMFGAYGIGLAVGFFGYLLVLWVMVWRSPNFTVDWFLDGRRKAPGPGEDPGSDVVQRPMDVPGSGPAISTGGGQ